MLGAPRPEAPPIGLSKFAKRRMSINRKSAAVPLENEGGGGDRQGDASSGGA
jgi:hypothetical protein